jgi:hypothetical protein
MLGPLKTLLQALLLCTLATQAPAMFIQPDWFEVTEPGVGTNRYSYSANDPVNKMDPSGNVMFDGFMDQEKSDEANYQAAAAHDAAATQIEEDESFWGAVQRGLGFGKKHRETANEFLDRVGVPKKERMLGDLQHFLGEAAWGIRAKVRVPAAQRASIIHSKVPEATQRRTTIAVTETTQGTRIVSSSEKRLRPNQRKELKPGEVEGVGIGHAEVTGVNAAKELGLTPTGTAATRPICPNCSDFLRRQGVHPLSPLKIK